MRRIKDGKIFGIAHYRKLLRPLQGKYIGYLDDIFVDPKYRGQKIGKKLPKYFVLYSGFLIKSSL